MKVGIGLGSALCTWIITMGGYDGTAAVQPASAVAMIRFGFGYSGAIIAVVCLALCFMMNIDKYIVTIQHDLEAKRNTK
jgi:glycoside/pentoside/hexuronide:cation symporter, GPH family